MKTRQLQGMLLGLAIGDALGAPVEHGYTSDEIAGRIERIASYAR